MSSKYSKQFESLLSEVCETIASKFNLDKDEVFSALQEDSKSVKKVAKKSTASRESSEDDNVSVKSVEESISVEKVMNPATTKDYLKAFCKSKGLTQSGKKEDIVKRVLDFLKKDCSQTTITQAKPVAKPASSKSSKTTSTPSVISSVVEKIGVNEIRKNKFGNYEHYESGLVFVKDSSTAIGHQNNDTGKIDSLTDRDIEMCKKFKFTYKIPANLNVGKGLENVKVDDLDDEEEDEEELDEDDLEEEEELEDEIDLEDD
jgi:hypothetical protein